MTSRDDYTPRDDVPEADLIDQTRAVALPTEDDAWR
jgi:hypothetical protein